MDDEPQEGSEPADGDETLHDDAILQETDILQETGPLLSRLEQALDRISLRAHAAGPADGSGPIGAPEIAGRLDALIAQLRMALADRPGSK